VQVGVLLFVRVCETPGCQGCFASNVNRINFLRTVLYIHPLYNTNIFREGILMPDGQVDGVFIQSMREGYCHQYLANTVGNIESTGATAWSQFLVLRHACERVGHGDKAPKKKAWQDAIRNYTLLNSDKHPFECPICGPPGQLRIIVVDGTTAGGTRRSLTKWQQVKTKAMPDDQTKGLQHSDLVTIDLMTRKERSLLLRFCGSHDVERETNFDEDGTMSHDVKRKPREKLRKGEFDELKKACHDHATWLVPTLDHVVSLNQNLEGDDVYNCTQKGRKWDVLRDVVQEVAACTKCYSLHNDVIKTIEVLECCVTLQGKDVLRDSRLEEALSVEVPLCNLVAEAYGTSMPEWFMHIVRMWLKRAKEFVSVVNALPGNGDVDVFRGRDARDEVYRDLNKLPRYELQQVDADAEKKAGNFCHVDLMQRRPPGNYPQDRKNEGQRQDRKERNAKAKAEREACMKEEKWHTDFLPGLFAMLCVHGVVYGIFFMDDHESPRTLFDIIFNRFTIPPEIIIYDNACHADHYFMTREPAFFANCQLYIDRVHQAGHVKCSCAYTLDIYSPGDAMIKYLNSQVAEQFNAILRKHSKVLKFMKGQTAMDHCIRVCGRVNIAKITKVMKRVGVEAP
jgi:hypothetical protein